MEKKSDQEIKVEVPKPKGKQFKKAQRLGNRIPFFRFLDAIPHVWNLNFYGLPNRMDCKSGYVCINSCYGKSKSVNTVIS